MVLKISDSVCVAENRGVGGTALLKVQTEGDGVNCEARRDNFHRPRPLEKHGDSDRRS